jgi:myosin heavy subunit
MDKFIEIFFFYLSEWQQVAINNVQYSVVIALGSLLIGVFLVVLLKSKNSVSLKQKLMQQNHALEQSEQKYDKLLTTQKNDAENISSLQQQIDQLTKDLQESEKQHNEFIQQEALSTKALDAKQLELDGLESTVNEKNQRVDQLQSELDEQKIQVSEHALEQAQLVVMEKEVSELSNKLNNVEQQIQTQLVELTNKNELIAQLELSAQSSEKNSDEASELKAENTRQDEESNVEQLLELENTLQQQNQQMTQFNETLQSLLIQPNADTENENSLTDANQASGGLFNKFLSKMSFLDNDNKTGAGQSHANDPVIEDVWQQHQKIIDQLIEQLSVQHTKSDVQTVDIEEERLSPKDTEEAVEQQSTQVDESADEMDQLKLKLKGFYRKLIS